MLYMSKPCYNELIIENIFTYKNDGKTPMCDKFKLVIFSHFERLYCIQDTPTRIVPQCDSRIPFLASLYRRMAQNLSRMGTVEAEKHFEQTLFNISRKQMYKMQAT